LNIVIFCSIEVTREEEKPLAAVRPLFAQSYSQFVHISLVNEHRHFQFPFSILYSPSSFTITLISTSGHHEIHR